MATAKRAGAIASFGLTGAPAKATPITEIPAQSTEPTTSRRHEPTGPRARFDAPAASSREMVQGTLRLHQDDAAEVDELRAALRRETGRRTLDQSAIIRALLKLAIDDADVRATLVRGLTTSRAHDVTTGDAA